MRPQKEISICIFGSFVRNSTDSHSDRDVLIVAPSRSEASVQIKIWEDANWSVAFYTWNRISKMAEAGSLFIQHLKQEGQIICDETLKLRTILEHFEAKANYSDDLESSFEMAKPLERMYNCTVSAACQGDILYTFFRNAMILKIANEGEYLFGYDELVQKLSINSVINSNEVEILHKLRHLKVSYRHRSWSFLDVKEILTKSKKIVSKCLDFDFISIPAMSDIRLFNVPYATLRDIEIRLLSHFDIFFLDNELEDDLINEIWNSIRDPRAYSWKTRSLNLENIESLNAILESPQFAIETKFRGYG